jgi:succinate dehydrogenase/fumarate reductase flavoprotein subunit
MALFSSQSSEMVDLDVLVLGAGGAGLRAALEAARCGARVTVVSKLGSEDPNCTVVAWGGMTYCPDDQRDELFRQVVETGGFLSNQRLVEAFVRETPERMRELAELGVPLDVLDGADQAGRLGMVKIRGQGRTTGYGLTRPLRAAAAAAGVRFLDHLLVTSLVQEGGLVSGALAVSLTDGSLVGLAARAVIVATGGGACLYGRTDNPAGTTADGIAVAYGAGADLVDLECVSFFFPEARLPELFAVCEAPDAGLLGVGAAHYFLGGIRIDERAQTTVPGLFAAGEATGGLFGAARLGGTAMADTIVFGAIAGREAAAYAARRRSAPVIGPERLAAGRGWLDALAGGRGASPAAFAAELAEIMWRDCGTMKTARTLQRAAAGLEELGRRPGFAVSTLPELRQAVECVHMLAVARLIVTASALRPETRGCFWRLDYPQPDNEKWLVNVVLRRAGNETVHELCPAVRTRPQTPTRPRIGAGCFSYLP